MKNKFLWAFLFSIFAVTNSWAQNSPGLTSKEIPFTDSQGNQWKRWVMTEDEGDNTTLLVVENPVKHEHDSSVSQEIVFRKTYNHANKKMLTQAIKYYSNLLDKKNKKANKTNADKVYPLADFGQNASPLPLWVPTKDSWTLDDEKDYADWSSKNDERIFVGTGLLNDCAKFAVARRWVFAREHLLPVANTIMGSRKLVGHWSGSAKWDALPSDPNWRKDERFKAALRYVMDSIYTHSIYDDLYPVEISKDFVTPGTIILVLYSTSTGHTQVIHGVGAASDKKLCGRPCISVIYGNEPAAETGYKAVAWIVNKGAKEGGFMRWRWPLFENGSWKLQEKARMPGFSLEQYSKADLQTTDYLSWIFEQVGIRSSVVDQAVVYANSLIEQISQRENLTALGYLMCSLVTCDPTSEMYGNYSTPSRDKRIRETKQNLLDTMAIIPAADADLAGYLESIKHIEILPGWDVKLEQFITIAGGPSDKMSADPTANIFERWSDETDNPFKQLQTLLWVFTEGFHQRQVEAESNHETTRGDQALRLLRGTLRERLSKLAPLEAEQIKTTTGATLSFYRPDVCTWNKDAIGYCTLYDFALSDHDMIDKMSSDPAANFYARWGFPKQ